MAKRKAPRVVESSPFASMIEGMKKNAFGLVQKLVQDKIKQIEMFGMKVALGIVLFIVGFFFILTSAAFFLHEAHNWSLSQGFLLVGLLAIFASYLIYVILHPKS